MEAFDHGLLDTRALQTFVEENAPGELARKTLLGNLAVLIAPPDQAPAIQI